MEPACFLLAPVRRQWAVHHHRHWPGTIHFLMAASAVLVICNGWICPANPVMTGNLQAIGFIVTWVLGWGIGGSLIDAGLIHAGVYSLEGGQLGTLVTFAVWSLLWVSGGVWLFQRWTQANRPGS